VGKLRIVPLTITAARVAVERWHSHHRAPLSGICCVGVESEGDLACVAVLGRPVSRMLDADDATAEVTRVASSGEVPHAASAALGAISRAALALGYRRLVSYTILGEAGTIYRACNWHPTAISGGGNGRRPLAHARRCNSPAPRYDGNTDHQLRR